MHTCTASQWRLSPAFQHPAFAVSCLCEASLKFRTNKKKERKINPPRSVDQSRDEFSKNNVLKRFLFPLFPIATSNQPSSGCPRRNRHLQRASPMKRTRQTDVSALFNSFIPAGFLYFGFLLFLFFFFPHYPQRKSFLKKRCEGASIPTHSHKCPGHVFLSRRRCEECDGFGPVVHLRCQSNPVRHLATR